ncbi:hypothetical protein HYV31_02655 [candidate division WWE3 bacterium]|nr:hypothetical protein [candidate division WWE3 bacterium]
MHNTFNKTEDLHTRSFKHHLTNLGLMGVLLALLVAPMSGFYMLSYSAPSTQGLNIPDYIPITITGGNTEVLSSESIRVEKNSKNDLNSENSTAEPSLELERNNRVLGIQNDLIQEVLNSSEALDFKDTNEETESYNTEQEFDPTQYSPANVYPIY